MPENQAFHRLLQRASCGDKAAFASLIEHASDQIHAYFSRHVRQPQDVEDLMQEYWLKVWKGRKTFRAERGAWQWLSTIAGNLLRDYLRKSGASLVAAADMTVAHPLWECALDVSKVTEQCLQRLPPQQRLAFYLCGVRDFTPREAAVLVHMNRSTLRNHLNQARKSLRAFLGRCFPEYMKKP